MIVNTDAENLLTDEEFLFLYEANKPVNLELPYYEYEKFNLGENISEDECKAGFRLERGDIECVAGVLQLPATFKCPQGSVCDRIEGICILLRRLAYPCHYSDMVSRFARPVPVLRMASYIVLNYVYDLHHHRITTWNHSILNPVALQKYADAVSERGAAINNCFGFVYGTVRPTCKPGENQRLVYNGHKRVHALKFQAVALPNALIGHLLGLVGKNAYLSKKISLSIYKSEAHASLVSLPYAHFFFCFFFCFCSNLLTNLVQYATSPTGQQMCIYGDPAYPLRVNVLAPFKGAALTPQMEAHTYMMRVLAQRVVQKLHDI